MTTQIRSWVEVVEDGAEEPLRWNLLINERPVPGGYVEKCDEGFRIHYPHLTEKILPTLDEAKRRLELAPPVFRESLKIGRMAQEGSDLITSEEAGEMLGVSRFRVNAMVASGVLAGLRRDGHTLVDRHSVERRLAKAEVTGPRGQFANRFLFYQSASEVNTLYVAEIEADDADEVAAAQSFTQRIQETKAGIAAVFNYSEMRSYMRTHRNEYLFETISLNELVCRFLPALGEDNLEVV